MKSRQSQNVSKHHHAKIVDDKASAHDQADQERLAMKPSRFSIAMAGCLMLGLVFGHSMDSINLFGFEYGSIAGLLIALIIWLWAGLKAWRFVTILAMIATFILLGISLYPMTDTPKEIEINRQEVTVTGHVKMVEEMTKSRQRIRFHPDHQTLWHDLPDYDLRLITSSSSPRLSPGDHIQAVVKITPILPKLLPGSFDFTAHAHRQGYAATGFVNTHRITGYQSVSWVNRLRATIQDRFFSHLSNDQAAVASAVIIGLRAALTPELREDYRAAGLAHLLAISGLHMALFWGSVMTVFRSGLALFPDFSSRYSNLKIAAVAAMPFGLFYLIVSGQPISAVRAFLMLALVMLAIILTRRGMTLHNVALVAIGILLFAPASITHPAFQMSFAAVYALVTGWMLLTRYRHHVQHIPWVLRYIGGIVLASILAAGASAPFLLHHFGTTTIWSVLANIIGMPLMGVIIIPFGALALFVMPFGLESLPLAVMGFGIDLLNILAGWIKGQPFSSITLPPPSGTVLVLFTMALLWPACFLGRWRYLAVLPLIAGFVLWHIAPQPIVSFTKLHGRGVAAFHAEDGNVYLSHRHVNAFTKSIVLKPFGQASSGTVSDYPCSDCGRGYQLIPLHDGRLGAMVYRPEGLTPSCKTADLVISLVVPKYPCRAGLVITLSDLDQTGGVLIYGGQPLRIETAKGDIKLQLINDRNNQ